MLVILFLILSVGIIMSSLVIRPGKIAVGIWAIFMTIAASCLLGYGMGASWERLANYDQYIYHFSQCSALFRSLAEQQKIGELTNDVILFDKRFNAKKDPKALQDVTYQLLQEGPYYQETNDSSAYQMKNHP
jgi:hypothetical protein